MRELLFKFAHDGGRGNSALARDKDNDDDNLVDIFEYKYVSLTGESVESLMLFSEIPDIWYQFCDTLKFEINVTEMQF